MCMHSYSCIIDRMIKSTKSEGKCKYICLATLDIEQYLPQIDRAHHVLPLFLINYCCIYIQYIQGKKKIFDTRHDRWMDGRENISSFDKKRYILSESRLTRLAGRQTVLPSGCEWIRGKNKPFSVNGRIRMPAWKTGVRLMDLQDSLWVATRR